MLVPSHRELLLAGRMQRGIMPAIPAAPGYEFFAHYQPVYSVGGDYYDFVDLAPGCLAVVLGDVVGKGIAAALMMARFSSETRHRVCSSSPEIAAAALNGQLHGYDMEELFITLCLGVLEFGSRRFTYCSAGHPLPLLRRANGRIEEHGADDAGFPLGIAADAVYRQVSLELEPGDVVLIYSDGVTDALNARGERYDSTRSPRLRERLGLASEGPRATGRTIVRDLQDFSEGYPQFDDITLLCFGPVRRQPDRDAKADAALKGQVPPLSAPVRSGMATIGPEMTPGASRGPEEVGNASGKRNDAVKRSTGPLKQSELAVILPAATGDLLPVGGHHFLEGMNHRGRSGLFMAGR